MADACGDLPTALRPGNCQCRAAALERAGARHWVGPCLACFSAASGRQRSSYLAVLPSGANVPGQAQITWAAVAVCRICGSPCIRLSLLLNPAAQAADAVAAGRPEPPLHIYEIGGGTGTLALNILVRGGLQAGLASSLPGSQVCLWF